MSPTYTHAVVAFEIALVLFGIVMLWQHAISPSARLKAAPAPLPAWDCEPLEFLLLLCVAVFGAVLFAFVGSAINRHLAITGDAATLVTGAGAQFGMLAGVLTFSVSVPSFRSRVRLTVPSIVESGVITFAISLPILGAASKAWEVLLGLFGLPAEKQDLIRMFAEAKSPTLLISLIVLATVIAPVTEELIFRAGIYRFLRTRAPRFLALLIPALIFASLHVNWSTLEGFASFVPLILLAVLFSLAYERTGNIGTTIIAHGLFNLNTILLILCGLGS